MAGDRTGRPSGDERRRRGGRREPGVIDLKAESAAISPEAATPPQAPAEAGRAGTPAEEGSAGESAGIASASTISPEPLAGALAAEARGEQHPAPADELPKTPADAGSDVTPAAEAALPETSEQVEPRGEPAQAPTTAVAAEDVALAEAAESDHAARLEEAEREAAALAPAPPAPTYAAPPPPPARRPGLMGPALVGLAAGFIGAGLLTLGLLLFGPAGDIGDRLASLESAVGERASRRTVEATEKKVAALETGAASLRGDVDGLTRSVQAIPAGQITDLAGRVDRLERNVADLASQPRPTGEASAAAAPPPAPPPPLVAARESAVLAMALLLRDSLSRGLPYEKELQALQSAGVDQARIDALRPFAASGAPGAPALAAQLEPLAARIANPAAPPAHTVSDRISATVSGLFKVRPVGEAEGDAPAALAAKAEALLKRGALLDASATLDRIPPADAAPVSAFRDTLHARVAADAAAAAILSSSVDELLAAARLQGAPTR